MCPWLLRREFNEALIPAFPFGTKAVTIDYTIRTLSAKGEMAEISIADKWRWIVHRKTFGRRAVDWPDPKFHVDTVTGIRRAWIHDEAHWCVECPPDKRQVQARTRRECRPGERCVDGKRIRLESS